MVMINSLCHYFVNSEYKPLRAVLMYKPGPEIEALDKPLDVLHIRNIDYRTMGKEYDEIIKLYEKLKINVYLIDTRNAKNSHLFNIMYTRDLLFMTPGGAILSSMKHNTRSNEVRYAERTLKGIDIPIRKVIEPAGTFEGADALWVNKGMVLTGVGNRTNVDGFFQLKDELKTQGIDCVSVPAPRGTQHLLGALQFVDSKLALARADLIDLEAIDFLKKNKIKIIELHENKEVREKQALNIVIIAPRKIIMPADCPATKKIYENHGIRVVGEVKISQLINGGGGLSCATAIITRTSQKKGGAHV